MIPLKDENPTRTVPVVTYLIVGLNFLVFFYMNIGSTGLIGQLGDQWLPYAMRPYTILGTQPELVRGLPNIPLPPISLWMTIFTSMFMHGSWLHILGNMLYLWIFGNNIEDNIGHLKYAMFYLLCGVGAAGLQILFNPNSPVPTLGASGAIAGVLGAYILLYPNARVISLLFIFIFIQIITVPAWLILGLWIVLQILSAVTVTTGVQTNVAVFAHIGGFFVGMVLLKLFGGKSNKSNYRIYS